MILWQKYYIKTKNIEKYMKKTYNLSLPNNSNINNLNKKSI